MPESALTKKIQAHFERLGKLVVCPAKGFLNHDYLIPGGYYPESWDWDGFFMGIHFATRKPQQAVHLKNWALNFIAAADAQGYVPGCITTEGPEKGHRSFQMKPFLAQGVYFASLFGKDFAWAKPHYEVIKRIVCHRETHKFDKRYGLFYWENAVQSGADNNPVLSNEPSERDSIIACDINTLQLREYLAMAKIAEHLGNQADLKYFAEKAVTLGKSINEKLFDERDCSYYNIIRETGEHIKRVSYSNFLPLWQKLAPAEKGREMITRYLWNKDHMLSGYGLRSVSRQDADYSNENMIHPHSNWRGPIWIVANYIYMNALLNYGFFDEAEQLASTIGELCLRDIEDNGSMHENYNAEDGSPLAPVDGGFISWNLLVENMLEDCATRKNKLLL